MPTAAAPVAPAARCRPPRARRAAAGIRPPAVDRRRLALAIAFISGLTSLGYQVTWNRLLGAGTGSSTYVFTVILVLFLIGIATGAILLGFIRTPRPLDPRPHRRRPAADRRAGHPRRRHPGLAELAVPGLVDPVPRCAAGVRAHVGPRRPAAHHRHGPDVPGDRGPARRRDRQRGHRHGLPGGRQHHRRDRRDVRAPVLRHPADRVAGDARGARADQRRASARSCSRARVGRTPSVRALGSVAAAGIAIVDRGLVRRRDSVPQPDDHADRVARRADLRGDRGRDRAGRRGQARLPAAVGQRDVDDADHRRHQADADPAADAPARVAEGPRDRVRDGDRVPELAHRRDQDGRGRARAVRARHVQVVLLGRRRRCSRTRTATSSSPTAGTTWS